MQVLFIIGSLSSGGAERVVSEMSNYWVRKGWNLSILTTNATKKKQDFYPLDSRIKRVDITPLKKLYKVAYFYNLFRNLRAKIKNEKPDVVISFMSGSNIVTIISMLGLKIPLIISDRHNPYTDKIGYLYKKIFYPLSNILVVQTEAVKKFYSNIGGLQIETIPNPIREFCQIENINEKSKIVSAVGRLNISIKGFDILIKSFAKISNNYKDWKLIIYGEGKDRGLLEELIREFSLEKRVILAGNLHNPRELISKTEIFVLSSLEEGFPNVLLEAMSVGLAVISFNCDYGPEEIIDNGKDGILIKVGDIDELSSTIARLIENSGLRRELGQNAKVKVSQKFHVNKIMEKWESLIYNGRI